MDQEDLEEGEISNSDEETAEINTKSPAADVATSSNEYSLLPRPTNPAMSYRAPQDALGRPPAQVFRESSAGLAANDSDADSYVSDDEVTGKRQKLQPLVSSQASAARKRNVWSDVLLEQNVSSKMLSGGGITSDEITTVERGVESYKPSGESRTVAVEEFERELAPVAGELWDVTEDGESMNTVHKRIGKKKKKHRVKSRLDLDYADNGFDNYAEYPPEEVCPADDERVIARYIARHLNEPKVVLIERVTRYAGREKALELFNATMDVEAAGGMKTIRGDTRRTPGGVFLQLLKKDKAISKDTLKDIFAIERENQKFAKKVFIKERQTRKRKYYNKGTNNDSEMSSLSPATAQGSFTEDLDLMEEPDIEIGVAS